jgi:hypothetical protein
MSCVEITDRMAELLTRLAVYPLPEEDLKRLRRTPEWLQAKAWGWVMQSGELTGTGSRHAGDLTKGILPEHL